MSESRQSTNEFVSPALSRRESVKLAFGSFLALFGAFRWGAICEALAAPVPADPAPGLPPDPFGLCDVCGAPASHQWADLLEVTHLGSEYREWEVLRRHSRCPAHDDRPKSVLLDGTVVYGPLPGSPIRMVEIAPGTTLSREQLAGVLDNARCGSSLPVLPPGASITYLL